MNDTEMQLAGETALITGAATGIGRATADLLADRGAHVLVHHHPDQRESADQFVNELRNRGARATSLSADLASRPEVLDLVERAVEIAGRLEIFINNAGIIPKGAFTSMTTDAWDELLSVNITAAFILLRDSVRHMLQHKIAGRVVIVSSYNATLAAPGMVGYAASKAAVTMLGRGVAREVAAEGIAVNMVAPAAIATPTNTQWSDSADDQRNLEWFVPMGHLGSPDDVAHAICFLCSTSARYITGATLAVDGGVTTSKR